MEKSPSRMFVTSMCKNGVLGEPNAANAAGMSGSTIIKVRNSPRREYISFLLKD